MINNLPDFIPFIFGLTTLLTVWFFYKATGNSKIVLSILLIWLVLQTIISLSGFFLNTDSMPPRLMLLLVIPFGLIVFLFISEKGKVFIDQLELKYLILLHVVRIPVELILYGLCLYKAVPELMTFEGRNFDILAGITAPFVYYFGFVKNRLNKNFLMIWNYISVLLLLNIVVNAVFSAPFPFQKFGFDQPNIAVLYFPFVWLPGCVVPLVLFSHLAAIRQLRMGKFNLKK